MSPDAQTEKESPWFFFFLALGVVCVVGSYIWIKRTFPPPPPSAIEQVSAHLGPTRWSELRFQGMPYMPVAPNEKKSVFLTEPVLRSILRAKEDGDPTAQRALAIFYLWRDEAGDVARTLAVLRQMPEGPERWNLEAVAYVQDGDPYQALDSIERAFEAAPTSSEILFNRALLIGNLPLPSQGEAAWALYFEAAAKAKGEESRKWAREARGHQARQAAREVPPLELGEARTQLKGRLLAASSPDDLRAIQDEYKDVLAQLGATGDTFLAKGVEYRAQLSTAEWAQVAEEGARLDRALKKAIGGGDAWRELEWLSESPDPIVSVGALRVLAYLEIVGGNIADARMRLDRIAAACDAIGCLEETVLAASDIGTVEGEQGNYRAAHEAFEEAMERLPEGFNYRRGELLNKKAYLSLRLGAPRQGLEYALEAAWVHLDREKMGPLASSLVNLGVALSGRDLRRASTLFYLEAMDVSEAEENVAGIVRAKANIGSEEAELGQQEAALAHLTGAVAAAREAKQALALLRALLATAMVQTRHGEDYERALEHAFEALGIARNLGHLHAEASALFTVAKASHRGNRGVDVEFLTRKLDLDEQVAAQSPNPLAKVRTQAMNGEGRGLMAQSLAGLGMQERSWKVLSDYDPRPLQADECRVAYASYDDDQGVVWAADAWGTRFQAFDMTANARPPSPWEEGLCPPDTKRLTVIENPYTLVGIGSPASRAARPEVPVIISRSPATPWPETLVEGPALVVHSPFPLIGREHLPRLPGAMTEARLIHGALPGSVEFSREAATPASLEDHASNAGLIHVGAHAESRTGTGAASYLLLAGDGGRLQVADALALPLAEREPVVVLSACAAGGAVEELERDGAGLPWAFLEAGASAVIATSERLDDRAAVDFSRAFYGAAAQGLNAQAAFEEALQSLRVDWPESVAASFAYYN